MHFHICMSNNKRDCIYNNANTVCMIMYACLFILHYDIFLHVREVATILTPGSLRSTQKPD